MYFSIILLRRVHPPCGNAGPAINAAKQKAKA